MALTRVAAPFRRRRWAMRLGLLLLIGFMGWLSNDTFRRYRLHLIFTKSFTGQDERFTPVKGVKSIAFGTPYFGRRWPTAAIDVWNCPGRKKCTVFDDITKADAVLFYHTDMYPWIWFTGLRQNPNRHKQVWVYFGLEPETRVTRLAYFLNGYFNWSLTYKTDSDVVYPYYKVTKIPAPRIGAQVNYAKGKSKMALMMTSHCEVYSRRLDYVKELQKYIEAEVVDGSGEICGRNICPRWTCDHSKLGYKFYLAFENSLCKDYITEKFWDNALIHKILPVVMGPSKVDYIKVAPPGSFIHVDDFASPKELAEYLKILNSSDILYNRYFEWRTNYTIVKTDSLCGLCDALHNETKLRTKKVYKHFTDFWDLTKHCKDKGRQVGSNIF